MTGPDDLGIDEEYEREKADYDSHLYDDADEHEDEEDL